MEAVEKKTGYSFSDRTLLETALTHSSYSREKNGSVECNERLEFLGDAMLDAITGDELFRMFPDREEGFLSKTRAALVCEKSLAGIAGKLNLGEDLRLGRGEEKSGGRSRPSILADAVEAIIGAVHIDGGYEAARKLVVDLLADDLENVRRGRIAIEDFKTAFQELLQSQGINVNMIRYEDAGQSGPDHDRTFTVRLLVDGKEEALCKGKSKKQAQQECARAALMRRRDAV